MRKQIWVVEVAPSAFIYPLKASNAPKLETIVEESSENTNITSQKAIYLVPAPPLQMGELHFQRPFSLPPPPLPPLHPPSSTRDDAVPPLSSLRDDPLASPPPHPFDPSQWPPHVLAQSGASRCHRKSHRA
ncbi:hypothetical protein STAS_27591 [Striga asiatica]|uniref:Uncharacterized protein n=1 Tax=Striga asiatica TaxID=4170 RepID=A0A5A7QZ06_STRAF|nr:hypothetical protein STAS_27591 [Striga asiatica]